MKANTQQTITTLTDKVAVPGCPDSLERFRSHAPAPWTPEVLAVLKRWGLTQVQLNLA